MKYLVIKKDITTLSCDAIVNSANQYLVKGSGICKKIYEMAGEEQLAKCLCGYKINEGECVVTDSFELHSKYIFHVLTPKYYIKNNLNIELLSSCYSSILKAASCYNCKSIAIPCIGTGHHEWPLDLSSNIALDTLYWVYNKLYTESTIEEIIFCCYTWQQYLTYKGLIYSRRL